jgi:hypothetical protein
LDNAERKEIEELVNSIIKTWWEKGPNVSIVTNKDKEQQFPIQSILQSFYNTNNNLRQRIENLEKQLEDLRNSVTERKLNDIILNRVNLWWRSEESVYMPKMNRKYPREEAFNASLSTVRNNRDRIEILEQNQSQNITKTEIQRVVLQTIENFMKKMRYSYYFQNHDSRLARLENEFAIENKKLKEELDFLKKQMSVQQTPKSFDSSNAQKINAQQSIVLSSSDQIVDVFNAWAKNPKTSLPPQFCYAEGGLKLREKQEIKYSSADNALWIVNSSGSTKYLFPNPNLIDQIGGDIDVLYSVTGTRRARGQNKVNIQKACVIMEDGWIEYKGALSLA